MPYRGRAGCLVSRKDRQGAGNRRADLTQGSSFGWNEGELFLFERVSSLSGTQSRAIVQEIRVMKGATRSHSKVHHGSSSELYARFGSSCSFAVTRGAGRAAKQYLPSFDAT